ncbi:MAG: hypothetical protein OXG39_08580 [Chloroflexi bacterium]|nr:hypothetical protein [Chloroflexota bacterium]
MKLLVALLLFLVASIGTAAQNEIDMSQRTILIQNVSQMSGNDLEHQTLLNMDGTWAVLAMLDVVFSWNPRFCNVEVILDKENLTTFQEEDYTLLSPFVSFLSINDLRVDEMIPDELDPFIVELKFSKCLDVLLFRVPKKNTSSGLILMFRK